MSAGEGHRRRPEPIRDRGRSAAGHRRPALRSDADDDAGRRRAQGVEVVLVREARDDVLPDQRVVPETVVLGRQPEHRRIGCGPLGVVDRQRAFVAGESEELRHRRPEALAVVRLADVDAGGQHLLAVRQRLAGRRLVCDERPDLLWMAGHERERVHGPAAAGEDVHGSGVDGRDHPVQVVGVLVGRGLGGAVGPLAPVHPAGVVGDDRPVGEVRGERGEPRGAHRRPDQEQDGLVAGLAAADVVGQHGARHVQCVSRRFVHEAFPRWSPSLLDQTRRFCRIHRSALRDPRLRPSRSVAS